MKNLVTRVKASLVAGACILISSAPAMASMTVSTLKTNVDSGISDLAEIALIGSAFIGLCLVIYGLFKAATHGRHKDPLGSAFLMMGIGAVMLVIPATIALLDSVGFSGSAGPATQLQQMNIN